MNTCEYSWITSTHTRLSGNTREYSSLVSGTSNRRVLVVAYLLSASVHSADLTSTCHLCLSLSGTDSSFRIPEIWEHRMAVQMDGTDVPSCQPDAANLGQLFKFYYYFYPFLFTFVMLRYAVSWFGLTSASREPVWRAVALAPMYMHSCALNIVPNIVHFCSLLQSMTSQILYWPTVINRWHWGVDEHCQCWMHKCGHQAAQRQPRHLPFLSGPYNKHSWITMNSW
jgi:hypothetical protein